MIVDSSAIVTILKREHDSAIFSRILEETTELSMSAATYFETCLVIDGMKDESLSKWLDDLMLRAQIEIVPVTVEQARIARQAYQNFGKGRGHKAGLNFGDCFSYALTKDKREPILFKGDGFQHTDLRSAV